MYTYNLFLDHVYELWWFGVKLWKIRSAEVKVINRIPQIDTLFSDQLYEILSDGIDTEPLIYGELKVANLRQ